MDDRAMRSLSKEINARKFFFGYILVPLVIFSAISVRAASDPSDLVVHFKTNGRELNASDQQRLKEAFKHQNIGPDTKILVVGYTDNTGTKNGNYALSRSRAHTVKTFLIGLLKLDTSKIVAVGRGAEAPVAGNDTVKNRALNRRAEVFILGKPGSIMIISESFDPASPPNPAYYMDLLKEAQRLVKLGNWENALDLLQQAKIKGAEHHALWHLLQGIIGYFQGLAPSRLIAYFETARELDPHNLDALDFLGRSKARQDFEAGLVMAGMGRSANSAIKVETISQEHEFMRLFQVEPLSQDRLPDQALDVWQCQTANMRRVTYYFDISNAHPWGFGDHQPKSSE